MCEFNVAKAVTSLNSVRDFTELRSILADAAGALGFTYFALMQSNSSRTDAGGIVVLNYPTAYMQHQSETFAYRNSPILLAVRSHNAPFLWSNLATMMKLTADHKQYMAEAAAAGLRHGFTVPIHVPGEPSGFVSFARDGENSINEACLPQAYFIASHAFAAGRRLKAEIVNEGARQQLESNDRKIIMLVAKGKSRWAIARKLSVTENTVAKSLLRTKRYYQVGSQTQAVVH
ncbi:MAG: autoinducer binding domain-containing protein, partial [Burkholderiales bacterium]|nr:autoinducer binding domain-containing protein [Phycisphaerae bacterium]